MNMTLILRNASAKTALKTPLMVVYLYNLSVVIGATPNLVNATQLNAQYLAAMKTVSQTVKTRPASARLGSPILLMDAKQMLKEAPSAVLGTTIAKIIA